MATVQRHRPSLTLPLIYMAIMIAHFSCVKADLCIPLLGGCGGSQTPAPMCIPRNGGSGGGGSSSLPLCSFSSLEITSGRPLPGSSDHNQNPSPFPSWINLTLARQGQEFARKNRFSIAYSALNGLLAGLSFPDARDVLCFTSGSDTADASLKRYMATAVQMYVWIDEILKMNLTCNSFATSISRVRAMHINAASRANAAPKPINDPAKYDAIQTDEVLWTAFVADLAAGPNFQQYNNYPQQYTAYDQNATFINQFVQGVTLAGFMGAAVLYTESCFLYNVTEEELRAFIHFWAIVGYSIGVDDEYNVCLRPTVADTRAYFTDIQNYYVLPSLFHLDKKGKVLLEAFTHGIYNGTIPALTPRTIMLKLLRDFFNVPVPHMTAILSQSDSAALVGWDTLFVPSTHLAPTRLALDTGLVTLLQGEVLANFGPYITNMDKAEHVYYPDLEE